MEEPDLKDIRRRMEKAIGVLADELAGLRGGRAAPAMLEPITVDIYGAHMPIGQLGSVTTPEPRTLSIQVWDANAVPAIDKAIRDSSLGLNPICEGQTIRVPIPELTRERRQEMVKVARQYAEQARVAIRNIRRDSIENVKIMEKQSLIGQDERKAWEKDIQDLTDQAVSEIDAAQSRKEKDIMPA